MCQAKQKLGSEKKTISAKKGEWCNKHQLYKEENGIETVEPWCAGKILHGLPPDSQRVIDLLNVVWTHVKMTNTEETMSTLAQDMFIDTSQCISRRAWTTKGKLSSLNTSSCIFSFGLQRVLLPEEYFLLLGFQQPETAGISATAMRSLSGEAMSLPQIGVCIAALASALPGIFLSGSRSNDQGSRP